MILNLLIFVWICLNNLFFDELDWLMVLNRLISENWILSDDLHLWLRQFWFDVILFYFFLFQRLDFMFFVYWNIVGQLRWLKIAREVN
jgi:hypothetical protein